MSEVIIGIDLGTTNSCMAVVRDGVARVIPNRGHLTTPSMVAVTASGKRVVGHAAKRQAIVNPEHTVFALKRLIGREWDSTQVRQTSMLSSYKVSEGARGDVRVELRGQTFSLPEISAMILAELRKAAEEELGVEVEKAVVTVPAYFNDNQRQATKDAGEIAGLEIIRMINEPTAAAVAYGFSKAGDRTVAVYDLGGGTFDISIVKVYGARDFEVLATNGDSYLGGEDFDGRVMDHLIESFQKEHQIDLRQDRTALQRLKDVAEQTKHALSEHLEHGFNLPFLAQRPGGEGIHLEATITRTQFESMTRDLVDRTMEVVRQTLAEAKLGVDGVDEVVLVGGSSRMPAVQRAIRELFGKEPSKAVHPDEAVAIGAALHANSLLGSSVEDKRVNLFDVTSHALGIVVAGGRFHPLIEKNTPIPARMMERFATSRPGQSRIEIIVVQGESEVASENERLGKFAINELPEGPVGDVAVDVSFAIDDSGIVSVTATDVASGRAHGIQVTASSAMSADEIERARLSQVQGEPS